LVGKKKRGGAFREFEQKEELPAPFLQGRKREKGKRCSLVPESHPEVGEGKVSRAATRGGGGEGEESYTNLSPPLEMT